MRIFLFLFAFSVCQAIFFYDGNSTAVTANSGELRKAEPISKEARRRKPSRPSRPAGGSRPSYSSGRSATPLIGFGVLLLSLLIL